MFSSASSEFFRNFRPFCSLNADQGDQFEILFPTPLFFADDWVDVVCPSLPTLGIGPEVVFVGEEKQFITDLFPLSSFFFFNVGPDNLFQDFHFLIAP